MWQLNRGSAVCYSMVTVTSGCWPPNWGSVVCYSTVTVTLVGVGRPIEVLLYVSVQLQSRGWVLATQYRFCCMLQYSYSHFGGCWPFNKVQLYVTVQLQSLWWVLATQYRFCCMLQYSYSHFCGCWPFNKVQLYVTVTLVGVGHSISFSCMLQYS